ncbi:hypothetical protein HYX70_00735 [Candidatus Saccharibacteria bacterium]|nr:hypothetical protein [Candidatus Saccharibacteria bacterium]
MLQAFSALLVAVVAAVLMAVIACFGLIFVFWRGAPYLPTFQTEIDRLFKSIKLPKRALVVDLGSGDGRLLKTAAENGFAAVGYEINPVLWLLSSWRLRKLKNVKVRFRSLWKADLAEADMVFIFGITRIMSKLEVKLDCELKSGATLVCNTFELKKAKQTRHLGTLHLYKF